MILNLNIAVMLIGIAYALDVTLDRATVEYVNNKYVDSAKLYVTRFGRKSPYYLNMEGRIKHLWNNNVSIHLVFYEYLHNEYRRSFVEMHFKYCDILNAPYVGPMIAHAGLTCPLPPKMHYLMNMTLDGSKFPHVWPFQKCRIELSMGLTDTDVVIGRGWVYANFVMPLKKNL